MATRSKKEKYLGFRICIEEWQRIADLQQKAELRNRGYAPMTDVLRELIGLTPYNLITVEERAALMEEQKVAAPKKASGPQRLAPGSR